MGPSSGGGGPTLLLLFFFKKERVIPLGLKHHIMLQSLLYIRAVKRKTVLTPEQDTFLGMGSEGPDTMIPIRAMQPQSTPDRAAAREERCQAAMKQCSPTVTMKLPDETAIE